MLDDLIKTSLKYRIDKARGCLKAADVLLSAESYMDSINRSYYCIYHSIRSALLTINFSSKTHSGNISEFRRNFIKTGIFPGEFSDIIGNAFDNRNDSDYEDFYIVSKEDAVNQLTNAKTFFLAIETYILSLYPNI